MIVARPGYPDLASIRELEQKEIEFSVFVHRGPVLTLEQAAAERGQRAEQVVRSLVFRLAADSFAMVLVAGPRKIPWQNLRSLFQQRRLTQANPEEVRQVTGYKVGSVSPFGLATDLPLHIDKSVIKETEISMGSGKAGTALLMKPVALRAALPAAKDVVLFEG